MKKFGKSLNRFWITFSDMDFLSIQVFNQESKGEKGLIDKPWL